VSAWGTPVIIGKRLDDRDVATAGGAAAGAGALTYGAGAEMRRRTNARVAGAVAGESSMRELLDRTRAETTRRNLRPNSTQRAGALDERARGRTKHDITVSQQKARLANVGQGVVEATERSEKVRSLSGRALRIAGRTRAAGAALVGLGAGVAGAAGARHEKERRA